MINDFTTNHLNCDEETRGKMQAWSDLDRLKSVASRSFW
jgi:hypothetical protein